MARFCYVNHKKLPNIRCFTYKFPCDFARLTDPKTRVRKDVLYKHKYPITLPCCQKAKYSPQNYIYKRTQINTITNQFALCKIFPQPSKLILPRRRHDEVEIFGTGGMILQNMKDLLQVTIDLGIETCTTQMLFFRYYNKKFPICMSFCRKYILNLSFIEYFIKLLKCF